MWLNKIIAQKIGLIVDSFIFVNKKGLALGNGTTKVEQKIGEAQIWLRASD